MALDLEVTIGLFIIFLIVLIGPFKVRTIEHNLEVFLFTCGLFAMTISGFANLAGAETGWRLEIIKEALTAPVSVVNLFGVPIGKVQIVLVGGLIIYKWHCNIHNAIRKMTNALPPKVMVFILIAVPSLVSSIISSLLAAIIFVEMINPLPFSRESKIDLTIIACFSIGLGAGLTPLGQPLSTIAVTKLAGPPHYAEFGYLIKLLGIYILPGIIAYSILGMFFVREVNPEDHIEGEDYSETLKDVIMTAVKFYVFIAALVLLGEGFKPIILEYFTSIPSVAVYWINTVSAVLDNATLAAAQIGPFLSEFQIKSALMALLISGGMLIPGNIPNIISAGKLDISSKEWAKLGIPLGLISMAIYFVILFVIEPLI
jgi:Predicted cation transporter